MAQPPKVVLLTMPWTTTIQPSLAVGILIAICAEESVPAVSLYPNMDMTAMLGFEAAGDLAVNRNLYGLSEHLFACDLFGREELCSDEYIETLAQDDLPKRFKDAAFVRHIRDEVVPAFLDGTTRRVLAQEPSVVGFSATFNQIMSGLSLARRLKKVRPDLPIIVGGASYDGEMGLEYQRALPDLLDHVFIGEADDSFREYLARHVAGQPTTGIAGVAWFAEERVQFAPARPLTDLNRSPRPNYDGFFAEKERLFRETGLVFNIESLPFESSRGCWWGYKNHCLFCGQNETSMAFREKDPDRVISEIVYLSARYRVLSLHASDWIISRKSRAELCRKLRDLDLDLGYFYETRSDLRKEEVALLRDAGVLKIQPGIESFSTELLQLMNKGTTRIRQVQFMRWCKEYQIHCGYNILSGFPGEKAEWYREMAAFLPRIIHLQPPRYNTHEIEMHRFSPLFERRDELGVNQWRIREDYGFNFPRGFIDLDRIGYFFSYDCAGVRLEEGYMEDLRVPIQQWIDAHEEKKPPVYNYSLGPGFLRITDTRQREARYLYLADLDHDVFLLCDHVQTLSSLKELLTPRYPAEVASGALESTVERMVREDILMQEGDAILALPIALHPRTTAQLYSYVLGDSCKKAPASQPTLAKAIDDVPPLI